MNYQQFIFWLQGFVDAHQNNTEIFNILNTVLNKAINVKYNVLIISDVNNNIIDLLKNNDNDLNLDL